MEGVYVYCMPFSSQRKELQFVKDYTLNEEEKSSFILNYKKVNDKVIIKYADGRPFVMPYTIELEKELLRRMKNQVLNTEKTQEKLRKERRKFTCFALIITILLAVVLMADIVVSKGIGVILINIILGGTFLTYCGLKINEQNKILKDIEKNRTFIENEDLLRTKIHEEMGIYTDTKKITKKFIKEISMMNQELKTLESDIEKLNINYIDKIPYNTFFDLYDLMEKNNQFSDIVNHAKTLSRRKK